MIFDPMITRGLPGFADNSGVENKFREVQQPEVGAGGDAIAWAVDRAKICARNRASGHCGQSP
jgi:hypothetical protein